MKRKVKIYLLIIFGMLALDLSQCYASEINDKVMQKESKAKIVILNPKDNDLANERERLPETGSTSESKIIISGLLLLLSGIYWIQKNNKDKKA
ncbi:LPXTG cell wall anchor domain-containing protein [Enterococcus casseliflavus]|nr:LPXTG cell wall anchor domain-containing protein [Enterococcus casseliflavus]